LIDEHGDTFDGDDVMALMGVRMAAEGRLHANTVVGTVMSNFGLERALANHRVRLVRTEVGDPSVAREMRANSYNLGGEQSGHVIFTDHSTTGDGLITALLVLSIMAETGKPLSELRAMRRVPQVLENVRVRERIPLAAMPQVEQVIASVQGRLDGNGRLLVRYSGTEMLARVMVEGEDPAEIKALAEEIGAAIRRYAGVV
jgi:phosphoglucosamine mutase